jgi:oligosaccharyltransferase complex subunit alpha (ribophorin I)
MRLSSIFLSCLAALTSASDTNITKPLTSRQILPSTFTPPQVFENVNLVRNIDLQKGYPRETVNVVVKNVEKVAQSEYYLPFEAEWIKRIGGLEVRDKKDANKPPFKVEVTEYDVERCGDEQLLAGRWQS